MAPRLRVLLADDEELIATTLGDAIEAGGYEVKVVRSGDEAAVALEREGFDAVITDVRMPGLGGIELLKKVRQEHTGTFVIVMTAYGTIESAVHAMKMGAYDYVTKPFLNEEVVRILDKIREVTALKAENARLRAELEGRYRFGSILGRSRVMQRLFGMIESVAASEFDVLITGERGTGKELVARAIHYNSPRKSRPFVAVNCGAIAPTLIESELFGHAKGAFTDAKSEKVGKFEYARGGTVFLDEITELRVDLQARLLRVLQQRAVVRVGENIERAIEMRVIAASNDNLQEAMAEGRLRADLYDRLNVLPIHLPPLRDREEDVALLLEHFLQEHGGGRPFDLDSRLLAALTCYSWPGNVRELENTVKRMVALAGGETHLTLEHLGPYLGSMAGANGGEDGSLVPTLSQVVAEAEKKYIQEVLGKTGNQKARTAEILGISRKNLWEKMKRYGLE